MSALSLLVFGLSWLLFIFCINCLIAGKVKRIDPRTALVYFTTAAMIGVFGEIFLDAAYNYAVGHPLWRYNILPIRDGYTSQYAIVTWGLYGFHLYLLHDSLAAKWSIVRTKHLALIFSIEALFVEALLTISAKLTLGEYFYYYYPADLWHVSSFQNLPFYFICGLVLFKTLKRFRKEPLFFSLLSGFFTFVLVFIAK